MLVAANTLFRVGSPDVFLSDFFCVLCALLRLFLLSIFAAWREIFRLNTPSDTEGMRLSTSSSQARAEW
jgi:hypothetical protein